MNYIYRIIFINFFFLEGDVISVHTFISDRDSNEFNLLLRLRHNEVAVSSKVFYFVFTGKERS